MQLLIKNINAILVCGDQHTKGLNGSQMANPGRIDDAYVAIDEGIIVDYGQMLNCPDVRAFNNVVDASGRFVFPTFVDSHTHLVFHESREEEFVQRIKGMTYEEIASKGGGILNSAKKLAAASADELYDQAWVRLKEVIAMGTGAIEIKSGYGLSFDAELKILRVIRRLKEKSPITIRATFLGAHAFPAKYKSDRQAYIDMLTDEILPVIKEEKLADYIDVFCEKGYFTVDETRHLLAKGEEVGLKAKIHGNQLANSGGVQVAVEMGALSVDHLEQIGPEEIACLLNSKTLPVVLPSCSFFLGLPYAPGREMIDAGLPLVMASDYNPGSTPSGNIPFLLSLGCIKMKLLPEEALTAVTINAAAALELESTHGSISKGKLANLLVTEPMRDLSYLPYSFGRTNIDSVIINGTIQKSF